MSLSEQTSSWDRKNASLYLAARQHSVLQPLEAAALNRYSTRPAVHPLRCSLERPARGRQTLAIRMTSFDGAIDERDLDE